jgi:hypothetical protein
MSLRPVKGLLQDDVLEHDECAAGYVGLLWQTAQSTVQIRFTSCATCLSGIPIRARYTPRGCPEQRIPVQAVELVTEQCAKSVDIRSSPQRFFQRVSNGSDATFACSLSVMFLISRATYSVFASIILAAHELGEAHAVLPSDHQER